MTEEMYANSGCKDTADSQTIDADSDMKEFKDVFMETSVRIGLSVGTLTPSKDADIKRDAEILTVSSNMEKIIF